MLWFQRRVFLTLFLYFGAAVLVLLLFFFSLLVLRFSGYVSEQSQSLGEIVVLCLIGLPTHVSYVLPPATGFAVFATFNRLQREGTWLGLIATGVTFSQILRVFFTFAALCCLITGLFTLWIGPSAARAYYDRAFALDADRLLLAVKPSEFVALSQGITLWVESKPRSDEMRNIFFSQKTDNGGALVITASAVQVFRRGRQGGILVLHNGALKHKLGGEKNERFVQFETMELSLQELVQPRRRVIDLVARLEVPTSVLLRDRHLGEREQEYRRETMLRFSFPLICLAYVSLLGCVFARVPLRRSRVWVKAGGSTGLLMLYSLAHIYAVTLAGGSGGEQWSVLYLWLITCGGALVLAYRLKR